MTDFIPYFAAVITLMFGAGFYLSVHGVKVKK
jgi:hypothetical protein